MAHPSPHWARYTNLAPNDLAAIRTNTPIVYIPWGALEWHGPHLPFGLDGITAEAVVERVAQQIGGVVLPTMWWSMTTLPHNDSLAIPTDVFRLLVDSILDDMARAGWKIAVIVTGHYAQGHEIVLMAAAEAAIKRTGLLTLVLPPLALVDEEMLDHAAFWEVSQLLALRPELVHLEALGNEPLTPHKHAILGRDPRGAASPSLGEQALAMAAGSIVRALDELLATSDPAPLLALYTQRRLRYQSYVRRYYRSSYEQAIRDWWEEQQ